MSMATIVLFRTRLEGLDGRELTSILRQAVTTSTSIESLNNLSSYFCRLVVTPTGAKWLHLPNSMRIPAERAIKSNWQIYLCLSNPISLRRIISATVIHSQNAIANVGPYMDRTLNSRSQVSMQL